MSQASSLAGAKVAPQTARARKGPWPDRAYGAALTALGAAAIAVAGVILLVLIDSSRPALAAIGIVKFVTGTDWDPVRESFGALPFLYGTLVTSGIALSLALPVGVGLALFLTEMAGASLRRVVGFALELLAGIPSVVFGLWGLFVLVPLLRLHVEPFLGRTFVFIGDTAPEVIAAFASVEPSMRVEHREGGHLIAWWSVTVCHGYRGFGPVAKWADGLHY